MKHVHWHDRQQRVVRDHHNVQPGLRWVGATGPDFCPADLEHAIDFVNALVYSNVDNGVYTAGFATTQQAYEEAVRRLFDALDHLEERLGRQCYLVGKRITEADRRLFATLVRVDPVYCGRSQCNLRRLVDLSNPWAYTREFCQGTGVDSTVYLDHVKRDHHGSHGTINPTGVVPLGPKIDDSLPHRRG